MHKRLIPALLPLPLSTVFLLLCSLFACIPPCSAQKTTLQSASELDYPPFALVRPDGTADGFSVELLRAVAEAADFNITIPVGPWHVLKQQLAEGRLDVLPLVAYSLERDEYFDFTVPYLQMSGTVFVRKGETSIRSEQDLRDKEVLVMQDDAAHEYAIQNNISQKLILTSSFEEAMRMLSAGKHDAVLCQYLMGLQLLKQLNIKNIVSVSTEKQMSLKPGKGKVSGFTQRFCIAVPEGRKKLLAQLNEGLAIVFANGTYDRLYKKWFGPILPEMPIPAAEVIKSALLILIPVSLLLALLGLWYLKREVQKKTHSLQTEIRERKQAEKALQANELMLRTILDTLPVGIWLTDQKGKIQYGNPAGHSIWQGAHCVEFEEYQTCRSEADKSDSPADWVIPLIVQNRQKSHKEEVKILCTDGTRKIISNWAVPVRDADEKIAGAVAVNQDITERIRIEQELIAERDFTKNLIETAQTVILVLNPDGAINTFNPYMEKISGYRLEEVQGKDWFATFLPDQNWQEMRKIFTTSLVDIQTRGNVAPIITKDGRQRYIEWYEKTLKDRNGTVLGLLSIGQDITEKRSMQKKLEEMALHDALTGLYNRKVLEEKLMGDIELAQSNKKELSLLQLDIDHFKRINDSHGHLEGDNVLRWIADILKRSIRKKDYAARYGGEEFTIVLPETSEQQAEALAESLRESINEHEVVTKKGERVELTVSIGVASLSGHVKSHQVLLLHAETALYAAKRGGRNQVGVT
ncbi:MAG: diguanylate cyclase [Candidatus Electrothrix aestuarii]|uniref:Diguanylate cyclase n=1 Tax=Candidatus Electrothrix aestuarii TaxID=3062594 RepID=A0AAU8LZJ6_9BACT|nr:diguanylate cyclase [Candidatus Electrothrix aestuarii]